MCTLSRPQLYFRIQSTRTLVSWDHALLLLSVQSPHMADLLQLKICRALAAVPSESNCEAPSVGMYKVAGKFPARHSGAPRTGGGVGMGGGVVVNSRQPSNDFAQSCDVVYK